MGVVVGLDTRGERSGSTGTQDRTVTGLGTASDIKGLFAFAHYNPTLGAEQANSRWAVGAADGVSQYVASGRIHSSGGRIHKGENDRFLQRLFATSTSGGQSESAFNSFITDGVRLTQNPVSGASWLNSLLMFSGSDVSCELVSITEGATTADATISQVPTFIIAFTSNDQFDGSGSHTQYASQSITLIHVDGTTPSYAGQCHSVAFGASNNNYAQVSTDGIHTIDPSQSTSATDGHFTISFPDSTTLRMTTVSPTGDAAPADVAFLCVTLTGDFAAAIGVLDTPTSTGSEVYSLGLGFTPQAVITLPTLLEAVNTFSTGANAGVFGVSAAVSPAGLTGQDQEVSAVTRNEDGVGTRDSAALTSATLFDLPSDDGASTEIEASLTSLDSGGFTADFTTVTGTAKKIPYLAISNAAVGGGGSTVEAVLSGGLSMGYQAAKEASLNAGFTGALSIAMATEASAQAEAALSFALSVSDAVSALVTAEAAFTVSQTLSDTTTGQTEAGGEIEGAVIFSANLAGLATADAAALATISSGIEAAGNVTAIVAIPSALSAGVQAGTTVTSFVGIGSNISAGILAGAQATGEAQAYAAISVDQSLGANLIAEAMAEAGLSVSSVQNVSFVGASISGDAVTPDGRRFRVALDLRTFEVSLETRSFKADQE